MTSRELLGAADVTDQQLAMMVADLLGEETVALLDVRVDAVDYELPAITTAGRWWVTGHATTSNGEEPFRIFVKQVQNWSRSPQFAMVPPEIREVAAASVPWRTEASVYRSDLADRLPEGLSMPRALAVIDLDALSSAVWLEEVPLREWPWDHERFERAAYLLGRLAGSSRVAPLAQIDDHQWSVLDYLHGRFEHQVVPMLHDDALWAHPLLVNAFGDGLRDRMRAALAQVPAWVEELADAPHHVGHGDACPNNLLGADRRDAFVLIDFGFWKPLPLGFDLGQLLLGDVQIGRRGAQDLDIVDARIVPAYVAGLNDEGHAVDPARVARLHALQMAVFTGLSSMPFEHLGSPPSPELERLAATRAAITTYCLGRVEATDGAAPR
ncbi:MAG TPA: hypothetical protein PLS63_11975 [Microthrixaceae bacterium]|nr:hypothetical protein [Microthrixaceae bacterium]